MDADDLAKSSRRRAGETAAAVGKLWEGQIEKELERLRLAGTIAWWDRHQPLFRPLGGGRFVPVKKGKADFGGMFRGGGLSLAIEAKSNEGGSCARSQFTAGEIDHLDITQAGGGLALVAFEYRMPLAPWLRFLAPWDRVPWRSSGAGSSVRADDLAPWAVQPGFVAQFVGWCAACAAWRLRARPCCGRRAP